MDGGNSGGYSNLRHELDEVQRSKAVHRRNASLASEFGSDTQLVLLDVPSPTAPSSQSPLLVQRGGFSTPISGSPQKVSPLVEASPTPSFRAVRNTASEPPRDAWEPLGPPPMAESVACCCIPLPAACCARCGTVHTGDSVWPLEGERGAKLPHLCMLVNSRSGGGVGGELVRKLTCVPHCTILDLSPDTFAAADESLVSTSARVQARLKEVIRAHAASGGTRVVAAGGDGTVSWVGAALAAVCYELTTAEAASVALAPFPLGTGNEVARVTGWGATCGPLLRNLPQWLSHVLLGRTVEMDVWTWSKTPHPSAPAPARDAAGGATGTAGGGGGAEKVVVGGAANGGATTTQHGDRTCDTEVVHGGARSSCLPPFFRRRGEPTRMRLRDSPSSGARDSSPTCSSSASKDKDELRFMMCFFSAGFDANIARQCHLLRERSRSCSRPSVLANKLWHVWYGAVELVSGFKYVSQVMELWVDGRFVPLPPNINTVQVLNIHASADGIDFFGVGQGSTTTELQSYSAPALGDGMLEVVGTGGVLDLVKIRMRATHAIRLAQGSLVELVVKQPTPAQLDGEPRLLSACRVRITRQSRRQPVVVGPGHTRSVPPPS